MWHDIKHVIQHYTRVSDNCSCIPRFFVAEYAAAVTASYSEYNHVNLAGKVLLTVHILEQTGKEVTLACHWKELFLH